VVAVSPTDDDRAVYTMTRDNMLEGDTGASAVARRLRQTTNPPALIRIRVPAHVGSNFEGLVVRVEDQLWKLVRTFDDPATWTEPGVRHLAANGLGGEAYRMSPLDDQWELYDLTDDPTEARNRWTDPSLHELRDQLQTQLKQARFSSIPERNRPWPYASRGDA
jgi:arylsulfatase A-like enzyme